RMMDACRHFNDETTAFCVKAERDFLKTLLGGCSAPISALARLENDQLILRSNLLSVNGIRKLKVEKKLPLERSYSLGMDAALEILDQGGDKIMEAIRKNEG
ncbi:MAG TPA: hypothetical protein VK644_01540, partial [Chitinophagaceae bacterium]|nr:hypothetical protein [Chitinophagaceae bacterium]